VTYSKIILILLILNYSVQELKASRVDDLMSKSDVVFLGENHCSMEHKKIAFDYIDQMGTNSQFDTFVFEMGEFNDTEILHQYFNDNEANPGTLKELYFICKLSGGKGRNYSFDQFRKLKITSPEQLRTGDICGGSERYRFRLPQLELYRKMKKAMRSTNKANLKFCGIDFDFEWPLKSYDKYKKLIKKMPLDVKRVFLERYGLVNEQSYLEYSDYILDSVRDIYMAFHIQQCTKGRKSALILAGMYHTYDSTEHVRECLNSHLINGTIEGIDPMLPTNKTCGETNQPRIEKGCYFDRPASMFEFYKMLSKNKREVAPINVSQLSFDKNPIFSPDRKLILEFQNKNNEKYSSMELIEFGNIPSQLKGFLNSPYIDRSRFRQSHILLTPESRDCCSEECR
jgi:hypothetical protein